MLILTFYEFVNLHDLENIRRAREVYLNCTQNGHRDGKYHQKKTNGQNFPRQGSSPRILPRFSAHHLTFRCQFSFDMQASLVLYSNCQKAMSYKVIKISPVLNVL